jgi:uncharacterized protein (DUF779 family)
MIKRIGATVEAIELIQTKRKHGDFFYQAGGCCEGTQPQCFEKEDFTNAWRVLLNWKK